METFIAHNDCDTLIVKKAIELSETMSVEVVAEDTDILVMLLHHVTRAPRDILLRTKGDIYSIQDIHDALTEREIEVVLFIHSFSGCDTVSFIYRQSKVGLIQKLSKDNQEFETVFPVLLSQDALQEEIVDAGLSLFIFIYGDIDVSLHIHRLRRYHKMTAKSVLRPEAFPPTDGAAKKHVLRSYLQFHDW